MNLDQRTFGDAPAALYLVNVLNELHDPKLTRIVSVQLTEVRTMCRQLERSHEAGYLDTHVLGRIVNSARSQTESLFASRKISAGEQELLAYNLATNLCVGELKSLLRRITSVSHAEQNSARVLGRLERDRGQLAGSLGSQRFFLSEAEDVTPSHLQEKSRRRLLRLMKPSKLY